MGNGQSVTFKWLVGVCASLLLWGWMNLNTQVTEQARQLAHGRERLSSVETNTSNLIQSIGIMDKRLIRIEDKLDRNLGAGRR